MTESLTDTMTVAQRDRLSEWLAENHENQGKWNRWNKFSSASKQHRIVSPSSATVWGALRDELGLSRSTKSKSKKRSASKTSFLKRPIVVAFTSMLVFGLFLLGLYLLRIGVGY